MEPFNIHSADWQNLIYLTLVLIALLGGLLVHRSMQFGKMAKMLLAWSVIVIGCVAVYAYRFELFEAKDRVMGELDPSNAQITPARIMVDVGSDGKFYVDATIGNDVVHFLIDQDVNAIVLNHADAKKIASPTANLVLDSTYYDHGKNLSGASVKIDQMVIGDTKIDNLDALVSEDDVAVSRLGSTFLKRFESYKISGGKILLSGLREAPGRITVRASSDGQFYMNVLMNGTKVRCMIDTGASTVSLDQSHIAALGLDPSKLRFDRSIQTANGSAEAASVLIDEIAIGGIKIRNMPAVLGKGDMGGVCLLGMEFLRRFKHYESSQGRFILSI